MKVSHKGEFKPILIEGLDWEEQQNVEFTIEVLMGGSDEEPLNVLNIFGEYKENGKKQKVKFEIPLTMDESKKLAKVIEKEY